jgi:SAM-dependent methyltransferase
MTNADKTDDWYKNYHARKGTDRNDLLRSAEVTFQNAASDIALVRALGRIDYQPQKQRVLDVGSGTGGGLIPFMYVGAHLELLTATEIRPEAVAEGRRRFPGLDYRCIDACAMPIESDSYDIVYSSTMFVTIPDDAIAAPIASEMIRVVKPEGYLVLRDWFVPKPGDPRYSALTRRRLRKLFPGIELLFVEKGALVPPVGRFLSAHLPALYFPVRACLPFLTGLGVYVLRKP